MLNQSHKSLRFAIPALFAVFVIPVVVVLTIYSAGLSRQVNDQLAQSNSSLVRVIGNDLLKEMGRIETYLEDASISNSELCNLGSESDMTRAYYMQQQVSKVFAPLLSSNRDIS